MPPQGVSKGTTLSPHNPQIRKTAESLLPRPSPVHGGLEVGTNSSIPPRENFSTHPDLGFKDADRTDPQLLPRENDTYTICDRRSSLDSDINSTRSEPKIADAKEFNRILKITKPPTFAGSTDKGYLAWKMSVKSEVSSLTLTPDQWYTLFIHRTTGDALNTVKKYGSYAGELPMKKIIASLWKELDRLFLLAFARPAEHWSGARQQDERGTEESLDSEAS